TLGDRGVLAVPARLAAARAAGERMGQALGYTGGATRPQPHQLRGQPVMNGALATRPREHALGGASCEHALPRLLSGASAGGPLTLERHLATHGPLPNLPAIRGRRESPLIARVQRAGLRGRGAAAFPTA